MRRQRFGPLVALAFALPLLEIVGIIVIGHLIGALWTVLLILAGMALGVLLIQRAGERSFRALTASLRQGQVPGSEVAQSGWTVATGALFLVPGFITDVLGVLVLIPFARRLLGRGLLGSTSRNTTWIPPVTPTQGDDPEPTVVRGDVL